METFSFIKGNDERQYEEYRTKRVILEKGTFGGYRPSKIYGRFDCPSVNNAIAKGQYVQHRVFFADELTAILTGYRPCARCMKERYPLWKQAEGQTAGDRKRALEIYRSLCGYWPGWHGSTVRV